jgi:hypothetical protein
MNGTVSDPIAEVAVMSTGSVEIRPEHVGPTRKNLYLWLATSRQWTAPRPINVYLVEHRDGLLLISRSEWQSLHKPFPQARGLMPRHIDLPGLRWRQVVPEPVSDPGVAPFDRGHDVFGDGSLLLLPTPGHTPGSLSMLVRRHGRPPLLMVGDLTYDDRLLAAGKIPGVGDRRTLRRTVRMVNELRTRLPGLVVLPAHDPGAVRRLQDQASRPGREIRS